MKITLNNVEYTAPTPKTGLWFAIQKIKTEQSKRVEEIQSIWAKIQPFEEQENLEDATAKELNTLMISCAQKTKSNKQILLKDKIQIIIDAFANQNVTQDTILQYFPLQNVNSKFDEIDNLLDDILAGRVEQLPNEQTPIA